MCRLVCVCAVALAVGVPATWSVAKPPPQFDQLAQTDDRPSAPGGAKYKAPAADGPVVALLDEGVDALLPEFGRDGGAIAREDRDVFAGVEAARVTPPWKGASGLPGWNFKIVEAPKKAGEFRYLRFAWKKVGGTGIMIQFYNPTKGDWTVRLHAGRNVHGMQPSKQVAAAPPGEWEVHTRDLFKEFGALTITGFTLAPLDGTSALFDHVLLGRTVADLDAATAAALGRSWPAKAMDKAERAAAWKDLMGSDRVKSAAAQRAFLASAPQQVAFIESQLAATTTDQEQQARVRKLIAELDADSFEVRDAATDALVEFGAPAVEAVRAALDAAPSDEVRYRARLILRKLGGGNVPVDRTGRLARVVRVLERADTAQARDLLARLAAGGYGADIAPDAKAALARLKKP